MNLTREVWAEINLSYFAHNLSIIKQRLRHNVHLLVVLKADAYGHGALELGKVALQQGAYQFGVATFEEAMELREAFRKARILIFGYSSPSLAKEIIQHNIEVCVYNKNMAHSLSEAAKTLNKTALIHIKLDTGMHRIGYQYNQKSIQEIQAISMLPHIKIQGIFTHFATADCKDLSYLNTQYINYQQFFDSLSIDKSSVLKHCANSAAIISAPQTHEDMVRLGIIGYGLKPSLEIDMQNLPLKAVMNLKTKIVHIKTLEKGQSISYGRTFSTTKRTKIATLPLGYADGYMRLLSNKAEVLIHGKRAKVVGNICMDQCMIDVSEIENVKVGDSVLLFGYDDLGNELSIDELAQHIGTINYELVCAVSKRVPRVYVENEAHN
ncbi:alanine racemase [Helicobacter sp. MIT 14-3879]|uniref:alanine racemase n=1 Tax=Helicobacter sp. MIT 14-3879 TaxID=2040649 RepID=UPI000E1F5136|nr:alanine racemase [Helicobacter sp. MIT 14-3879]RDU61268.1 alanine racemase [Helicobacter sp. MIT 14-3879]